MSDNYQLVKGKRQVSIYPVVPRIHGKLKKKKPLMLTGNGFSVSCSMGKSDTNIQCACIIHALLIAWMNPARLIYFLHENDKTGEEGLRLHSKSWEHQSYGGLAGVWCLPLVCCNSRSASRTRIPHQYASCPCQEFV